MNLFVVKFSITTMRNVGMINHQHMKLASVLQILPLRKMCGLHSHVMLLSWNHSNFVSIEHQSSTVPVPQTSSYYATVSHRHARFLLAISTVNSVPGLLTSFGSRRRLVCIIALALSLYGPSRSLLQSSFSTRKVAALRTGFL